MRGRAGMQDVAAFSSAGAKGIAPAAALSAVVSAMVGSLAVRNRQKCTSCTNATGCAVGDSAAASVVPASSCTPSFTVGSGTSGAAVGSCARNGAPE